MADSDPAWVVKYREAGFFVRDFVPFRMYTNVATQEGGTVLGYWISWFENPDGILQKFSPAEMEIVEDDVLTWGITNQLEARHGVERLNRYEEAEYRERLKSVSLAELRRQRGLWQELQNRSPLRTPNLGLELEYAPLRMLSNEIQEKIADSIQSVQPQEAAAKSKRHKRRTAKKPSWTKTKSEFCRFIHDEYNAHHDQYMSLRDATFKIFPKYKFSDKAWTVHDCYELVKKV